MTLQCQNYKKTESIENRSISKYYEPAAAVYHCLKETDTKKKD